MCDNWETCEDVHRTLVEGGLIVLDLDPDQAEQSEIMLADVFFVT